MKIPKISLNKMVRSSRFRYVVSFLAALLITLLAWVFFSQSPIKEEVVTTPSRQDIRVSDLPNTPSQSTDNPQIQQSPSAPIPSPAFSPPAPRQESSIAPPRKPLTIDFDNLDTYLEKMPPQSVALTFDDGPSPKYTRHILRLLDEYGAKATFFVIGQRVSSPEGCAIVQEIVRRGHEIGNHTYNHPFLTKISSEEQATELKQTQEVVQKCLANTFAPQWFRPPYGDKNRTVLELATKLNLSTALWSIDTRDWSKDATANSIANITLGGGTQQIIIMHDDIELNPNLGSPLASSSRQNTVDALQVILASFNSQGIKSVTLSQAFM